MGKVDLTFKIGDPVKYFPNCNLANDMGIWIVKDVVNKHALECSWYDYEITNIADRTITPDGINPLLGKYVWKCNATRRYEGYETTSINQEETETTTQTYKYYYWSE